MPNPLSLAISRQPDEVTCGPTCLHAVYRYFEDSISLDNVIQEVSQLQAGGTLDVFLANHALRRGYRVTIYTYNLAIFDPSWFNEPGVDLAERLEAQQRCKLDLKLSVATQGYLEFLRLGGEIRFEDLSQSLLRSYLEQGTPILTGLSSTYLYHDKREIPATCESDDIHGEPAGHFVVAAGYEDGKVSIADPWHDNPLGHQDPGSPRRYYSVPIERLMGAILLGVMTYDANLLVIEPAANT